MIKKKCNENRFLNAILDCPSRGDCEKSSASSFHSGFWNFFILSQRRLFLVLPCLDTVWAVLIQFIHKFSLCLAKKIVKAVHFLDAWGQICGRKKINLVTLWFVFCQGFRMLWKNWQAQPNREVNHRQAQQESKTPTHHRGEQTKTIEMGNNLQLLPEIKMNKTIYPQHVSCLYCWYINSSLFFLKKFFFYCCIDINLEKENKGALL